MSTWECAPGLMEAVVATEASKRPPPEPGGCTQDTDWRNGRQQRCCLNESRKEGGSGGGRLTAKTLTSASQGQLCCVNPDQSDTQPWGAAAAPTS